MNENKISVIVPAYNVEKYIDECINSLKRQTYKNIEFIIINDGSKDSTLKRIKNNVGSDTRFKIIDQKNIGIGATRNKGINLSTGDYIAFLDSDDYVLDDMYSSLMESIIKNNSDIAVCDYIKFNNVNKEKKICGDIKIYNKSIYKEPLIINSVAYCPWNKLYKKSLIENIKFPEKLKYEDLNFVIKALSSAKKISKVDKALYYYRINDSGETCTISVKDKDIYFIIEDVVNYLKDKEDYNNIYDQVQEMSVLQIQKGLLSLIKVGSFSDNYSYIDKMFKFLNNEFPNWKKSNVILNMPKKERIIKTSKTRYKLFVFLRIIKREIFKR